MAFAIGMIYPDPIVGVYIDKTMNAELFQRGIDAFRLYSPSFIPLGAVIILMGYFTSIELPKSAMSISIGRGLVFASTFVILLSYFFGEAGVWMSAAVSEMCALLLALILYRKQKRTIKNNMA